MKFIQSTEKELHALEDVIAAIDQYENLRKQYEIVKNHAKIDNNKEMKNLKVGIKTNDLFAAYNRFMKDETKETLRGKTTNKTIIIEVIQKQPTENYVFGYEEQNDEKYFFLSRIEYFRNEGKPEDNKYFHVQDEVVLLHECETIVEETKKNFKVYWKDHAKNETFLFVSAPTKQIAKTKAEEYIPKMYSGAFRITEIEEK